MNATTVVQQENGGDTRKGVMFIRFMFPSDGFTGAKTIVLGNSMKETYPVDEEVVGGKTYGRVVILNKGRQWNSQQSGYGRGGRSGHFSLEGSNLRAVDLQGLADIGGSNGTITVIVLFEEASESIIAWHSN